MQHARPHLETHSRSLGHSAVAGAAYRLGLQLYDEKAGVMRDFRKRKLGEEIVLALTVAPKGTPSWATDPAELWNRVERAETRKDAQLARDYRIPIPFHLTDEQAGQLSKDMATFIAEELFTPVSIGLHRDGELDAQGLPKPNEKQGFHAHLYFPTRALIELDDSDGSSGSGSGSASGTGFGPKLTVLSNKRTSVAFVEAMNAKWAMLANQYTSTSGLVSDYDHRSYKRIGLNLTPTPTLGRHAVAMERKGLPTWKGDRLREAQVIAKVFERAHAVSLQAQHAQAVMDVTRENRAPLQKSALLVPSGLKTQSAPAKPKRPTSKPRFISVLAGGTTLAERIRNMGASPTTWAERETLERLLVYINIVERCAVLVDEYLREKAKLERERERAKAAELEAEFQLSRSRGYRSRAYVEIRDWEKQHPWRVKVASMAGPSAKHEDLKRLQFQLQVHDTHVQTFKASVHAHKRSSEDAGKGIANVTVQIIEQEAKLVDALRDVAGLKPKLLDTLPALMPVSQREIVREAINTVQAVVGSGGDDVVADIENNSSMKPLPPVPKM